MADKIEVKKKSSTKINPKNFVKIGRLKEIRDSLMSEALEKAKIGISISRGGNDESAKKYFEQGTLDATAAKKYGRIIDKNKK